jgi:hypothetical protein
VGKEGFLFVDVVATSLAGVRPGFVGKAVRLVIAVPVVAKTKLGGNRFSHVGFDFGRSEMRICRI